MDSPPYRFIDMQSRCDAKRYFGFWASAEISNNPIPLLQVIVHQSETSKSSSVNTYTAHSNRFDVKCSYDLLIDN